MFGMWDRESCNKGLPVQKSRECGTSQTSTSSAVHPAPALPAPPLRRNPEPIDRRVPFPPQQYDQQRGMRIRADQGRGQGYIMAAEASDDAAEWEDQYPEQEP